ncbi:ABC transporter ATP-binding protein [Rhodoblastus acidophilus]|uniref:Spermidine/putrescine import ATP-binding protein PotA n=1 Tax=Candidatus Rhodoblastus alkanivorans TaxID=2954117 RepID=A0ABS9Z4Z5_9HYPH|nr:ABC transporter ATP-binding protein [Candidatus Rhodoblastus alkanivorans]MCI4680261.1 ABC transporter ATP-binding protein [Candidatus Rhodoblastus alkanivorans]MCI4682750.1 ABC transporter ATP-binding protein [Candidatus Rhodoblastus alkanivorans]MDI4640057.1 ABC transporter ATP-binding protein [Rhodoblastus acidophilus]
MIQVEGLTKKFGRDMAVTGVDLAIAAGEFFAILGGSGSGKTTLLRMIAGFERPDKGRVLIDGADMTDAPPHRRPVNMMFQSYALFPHMSVAKNIEFGLRQEGLRGAELRRRADEALDLVVMRDFADRKPHQLSGGQKQRVALARAIVKRPKVLLLDEPLSALDRKLRETTQMHLLEVQKRTGVTFVVVTHDQDEAMTLASRVAVMNAGRIEQVDTPRALYARPANRFVAGFVGATNLLPARASGEGLLGEGVLTFLAPAAPVLGVGVFWASIRPENITIARRANCLPRANAEHGAVEALSYYGDHTVYFVRAEGGALLRAAQFNAVHGGPGFKIGDAVSVCWPPEAITVLRA